MHLANHSRQAGPVQAAGLAAPAPTARLSTVATRSGLDASSTCIAPSRRASRADVRQPVCVWPLHPHEHSATYDSTSPKRDAEVLDDDRVPTGAQAGERRVSRIVDAQDGVQDSHVGDPPDCGRVWRNDELEAAIVQLQLRACTEEHRDHGRVDERAVGQIHHHVAPRAGPRQSVADGLRAAQVVLAVQRDEGDSGQADIHLDSRSCGGLGVL